MSGVTADTGRSPADAARLARQWVIRMAAGGLSIVLASAAAAQFSTPPSDTSLAGQTVTIIVGTTTGGSTDLAARLMAPYLGKYLPGDPNVVVRNQPGAAGLAAFNSFAQKSAPDGKTAIIGSGYQMDPINYRVPQSRYDPTEFAIVGALSMGGTALIIRNEALPRLTDKSQAPIAMASVPGLPRAGMQMAAWGIEFLGWNVRWVPGYPGNTDLRLALQRGEADMTSLATTQLTSDLLDKSQFTLLFQSGSNGGTAPSLLPALKGVPMITETMETRIGDPLVRQAFAYWALNSAINNWMALPPKTPDAIARMHRQAFDRMIADPEFLQRARQLGEDVSTFSHQGMAKIIHTLAALPPEALSYMGDVLVKQGLKKDTKD